MKSGIKSRKTLFAAAAAVAFAAVAVVSVEKGAFVPTNGSSNINESSNIGELLSIRDGSSTVNNGTIWFKVRNAKSNGDGNDHYDYDTGRKMLRLVTDGKVGSPRAATNAEMRAISLAIGQSLKNDQYPDDFDFLSTVQASLLSAAAPGKNMARNSTGPSQPEAAPLAFYNEPSNIGGLLSIEGGSTSIKNGGIWFKIGGKNEGAQTGRLGFWGNHYEYDTNAKTLRLVTDGKVGSPRAVTDAEMWAIFSAISQVLRDGQYTEIMGTVFTKQKMPSAFSFLAEVKTSILSADTAHIHRLPQREVVSLIPYSESTSYSFSIPETFACSGPGGNAKARYGYISSDITVTPNGAKEPGQPVNNGTTYGEKKAAARAFCLGLQ